MYLAAQYWILGERPQLAMVMSRREVIYRPISHDFIGWDSGLTKLTLYTVVEDLTLGMGALFPCVHAYTNNFTPPGCRDPTGLHCWIEAKLKESITWSVMNCPERRAQF
ncbi:hypothetical protein TanjilG_24333 [Lupinus angustifolius]|uniref:Uncharacterized protein n=1 Tax=Lupinus angustifolius TaxID=3871 RepID=A0A394DC97_LUPAN|nr:hypothetical protein TanjilG_24333 [Lupinus angustifolius]